MSGIKSYFAPGRDEAHKRKESEKTVEMVETPRVPAPPKSRAGESTPGTPGSPWSSRPGSIYPVGDFRNNAMEEVNDIKCDVMVNWLHSQQEEKLWTSGEYEEGVVLKKSRGAYACSPPDLAEERFGFFKAVETLNVRVGQGPTTVRHVTHLTRYRLP